MEEIASAIGGKTFFGEGDKYIVKTRASMEEKVARSKALKEAYGQFPSETDIVKLLNDSLRGTIIVEDIYQCLAVINLLRRECRYVEYDLVFSNKFEAEYPNGYVGIHAKVVYKYSFNGQERSIVSEIQLHFRSIEDGTPSCPNQSTHRIYEESRKILSQDDEAIARRTSLETAIKLQFLMGMEEIV